MHFLNFCTCPSSQRCSSVEQGYNELHNKYADVTSEKGRLEQQVIALQREVENERSERSHGSEHLQTLESKSSSSSLLFFI